MLRNYAHRGSGHSLILISSYFKVLLLGIIINEVQEASVDVMKTTTIAVEFIDFYEVTYSFYNLRILIIFILKSIIKPLDCLDHVSCLWWKGLLFQLLQF